MVYLIAFFVPYWVGRFIFLTVFPQLQISTGATNILQFTYSNLPALCFIPAFFSSLLTFRFRDRSTALVWIIPLTVLVYSFATFETRNSVLEPDPTFSKASFLKAFDYYFDHHFAIPRFRSGREFWDIAASNPDVMRGVRQLAIVGPLYVALGYSLAAWLCLRTGLDKKILAAVEEFFERIGPPPSIELACGDDPELPTPRFPPEPPASS